MFKDSGSSSTHVCVGVVTVYTLQVNELQRRQCKDHEKEVRKREKVQEKEKAERAAQAKLKMEEEAYQLQVCWRMALLTRSCHVAHPLLCMFCS